MIQPGKISWLLFLVAGFQVVRDLNGVTCGLDVVLDLFIGFIYLLPKISDVIITFDIFPRLTAKHEITGKSKISPKHIIDWSMFSGVMDCGAVSQ